MPDATIEFQYNVLKRKLFDKYYSKLNDLKLETLADRTDIYSSGQKYADEGFYLLIVRNLYGNEKIYRITILKTFGSTASVTFSDGHQIYYSMDYVGKLYSDNKITLDLFDENITYAVTLDGVPYTGFAHSTENGVT